VHGASKRLRRIVRPAEDIEDGFDDPLRFLPRHVFPRWNAPGEYLGSVKFDRVWILRKNALGEPIKFLRNPGRLGLVDRDAA
jgi:hypothetical protein